MRLKLTAACSIAALSLALAAPASAANAPPYFPIVPTAQAEQRTVVLTGHDLTLEDIIAVARHGAKVRFAPEAIASAEAGRGLLDQGNAEGMAIYGTNRGGGALREVRTARGELSALAGARAGSREGALPEIDDEALVRAFLVIQANHMPYNAAGREYMEAVLGLLNQRVTPVMYSLGTLGEGDLFLTSNFNATLVGRGYAYYRGERMPAAQALQRAGLKPLNTQTGGGTTNAYASAIAAFLVMDGKDALEWADLTLAMDLLAMNSSITPLTPLVQGRRPFQWVNWEAAKLLETLRESYLLQDDPTRVLQDAESLRASHIRLGSAWQAWARLRDSVVQQINSGEQNPAIFLDAKPTDAWVLSSPWVMKYYVKGGPLSNGRTGFVLSNANWDPYPMTNDIEAFNLAFANMAVTVASRIDRFNDRGPTAFFTVIKPTDVLTPEQYARSPHLSEPFFTYLDVWKEIQVLTQSVPPDSSGSDFGVADLEAVSRLKANRGLKAVDLFMQLLSYDFITSTYWLDVRKIQTPARSFGPAATAAWTAFRKVVPWQLDQDDREPIPYGVQAYHFMKANPARTFMAGITTPAAPASPSPPPRMAK